MATFIPVKSGNTYSSSSSVQSRKTYGQKIQMLQDTYVSALYFELNGSVATIAVSIYDFDTRALIAQSADIPVSFSSGAPGTESIRFPLQSAVKLLAGKHYYFAMRDVSGSINVRLGNATAGTAYGDKYKFAISENAVKGTPSSGQGFPTDNYFATAFIVGFEVSIADPQSVEFLTGFNKGSVTGTDCTYRVTDPDAAATSLTVTVNGITILSETNPTTSVVKTLNLSTVWGSLPYGKVPIVFQFTDNRGNSTTIRDVLVKLLPNSLPILDSVAELNRAFNEVINKRGAIARQLGISESTSFDDTVKHMIANPPKKKATGTMFSSSTNLSFTTGGGGSSNYRYLTVQGLDFVPSIVFFLDAGNSFYPVLMMYSHLNNICTFYGTTTFSIVGGNSYVNATGFRLPTGETFNRNIVWVAIE